MTEKAIVNKENKEIFYNIVSSLVHILVTTIILFYIYRLAKFKLGIEIIGLWSVIVAIASFGNIGTFGFSGSLIKHTAELKAKNILHVIPGILNSSVIFMCIILFFYLSLLYGGTRLFLDLIVDIKYLQLAYSLVPYALFTFFINAISFLMLSVIEGLNRNWQKNIILVLSQVMLLISSIYLIPLYGIHGLIYSQLAQALVVFFGACILIKVNLLSPKIWVLNRDKLLLRDVFTYGLKFQSISIFQMMFEPITKMFLSRYGGLGIVGIFEIASRLILQCRSILAALTTNLLPKLVNIHTTKTFDHVNITFEKVFKVNYDLFAIAFGGIFIFCPFIVKIWIGEENSQLIYIIKLLSVAWFINSVIIVPYIYNLGSGFLNSNVISHAIMAALNLIIGLIIIFLNVNYLWFIYSMVFSLIIGSMYLMSEYLGRTRIKQNLLWNKSDCSILIIIGLSFFLFKLLYDILNYDLYVVSGLVCLLYGCMIIMYLRVSRSFNFILTYLSSFSKFFRAFTS